MEACPRFPTLTARQARGPCQPAPGSSRSCRQYEQCDAAAEPGNEGQTPQLVEIGDIARGVHDPGGDENMGDLGRSGRISAGEVGWNCTCIWVGEATGLLTFGATTLIRGASGAGMALAAKRSGAARDSAASCSLTNWAWAIPLQAAVIAANTIKSKWRGRFMAGISVDGADANAAVFARLRMGGI